MQIGRNISISGRVINDTYIIKVYIMENITDIYGILVSIIVASYILFVDIKVSIKL